MHIVDGGTPVYDIIGLSKSNSQYRSSPAFVIDFSGVVSRSQTFLGENDSLY